MDVATPVATLKTLRQQRAGRLAETGGRYWGSQIERNESSP